MVSQLPGETQTRGAIFYPDTDGQPMADNTLQFRWIVTIKENLEWLFTDDPRVFVAGDLLWYPIEGDNKTRFAPDVMVVLGRPKGDRGSYQQWREDNLAPQVVFEILSPGNTFKEMSRKLLAYERFGVEEYYQYDPDTNELTGWLRNSERFLEVIDEINGWLSPRLKIRFNLSGEALQILRPDGQLFVTYTEIAQRWEQEKQRANEAELRAQEAEEKAKRLEEKLRSLGLNLEEL